MCELLVGLPEVNILGVIDEPGAPLVVKVELRGLVLTCLVCGLGASLKDRNEVDHVDLDAVDESRAILQAGSVEAVTAMRAGIDGAYDRLNEAIAP